MTTNKKILVVDDDERLRELLQRYLTEQGYEVSVAADAIEMGKLFQPTTCDLIVLDLMLPGEDGLSICRRLRGNDIHTPIIMLTAKSEDIDRILGLEMGADDYLSKPFNPRELLARINAILRRAQAPEPPVTTLPTEEIITFGPFTLNMNTRTLSRDGHLIAMTTGEYDLLKVFAQNPHTPISRDRLVELSRGKEYDAVNRTLDVQISRLRRLIEPNPSEPIYIQTVWGKGYVFIPDIS